MNENALSDLLAGGTAMATAPDLSTLEGVSAFMSEARLLGDTKIFMRPSVENGSIIEAQWANKAVVFVGSAARLAINKRFDLVRLENCCGYKGTAEEVAGQDVIIVSMGAIAGLDPAQVILMLGGAATRAYRGDKIATGMEKISTIAQAAAVDIDITTSDDVMKKTMVTYAKTKEQTFIFAELAPFVTHAVATV